MSRPLRVEVGWLAASSIAGLAALVLLLALLSGAGSSIAAQPSLEPTMTAEVVLRGGDPRSEGEGPGVVGSPLVILAGVVALGLATVLVTVVLARLSQRD